MMATISDDVRQQVRERAQRRCEYCQAQERIVIYLEIDHIIPQSKAVSSLPDNLCYCCRNCNTYKHHHTTAIDLKTNETVALLNPRIDRWHDHFAWDDSGTILLDKTSVARATIETLKINRELNRLARETWVQAGWHPPTD